MEETSGSGRSSSSAVTVLRDAMEPTGEVCGRCGGEIVLARLDGADVVIVECSCGEALSAA